MQNHQGFSYDDVVADKQLTVIVFIILWEELFEERNFITSARATMKIVLCNADQVSSNNANEIFKKINITLAFAELSYKYIFFFYLENILSPEINYQ